MQSNVEENGGKFMIKMLMLLKNFQQKNGIFNQILFLLLSKPLYKDVPN
jgi:hypothetical protein